MKSNETGALSDAESLQPLEELKANFNGIVNSTSEGILIIGLDGTILFANPGVEILLNKRSNSLLGENFGIPLTSNHKVNVDIIRANHNPGFGEMRVEKTTWQGRDAYLLLLLDITDLHTAQQSLQTANEELEAKVAERTEALRLANKELNRSNEALEEFAYVASHDLQEPLSIITMYLDLLQTQCKGKLDKNGDEFIVYAKQGAQRSQKLIRDLLKYARIGARETLSEIIDFESILKQVLSDLRLVISESGGKVTHDPLPELKADRSQIQQLFQNLLSNALKYKAPAPLKVHISAQQQDTHWLFSMTDNGIGIDPQYKDRIFAIFQRIPTKSEDSGTGIGLAICKKIVERHGGKLWVESKLHEGSVFHFTIPRI